MNTNSLTFNTSNLPKLTYSVLIEEEKERGYTVTVLGWPEWEAFGATREEARSKSAPAFDCPFRKS